MINTSIVMLLREQMRRVRLQVEAGEAFDACHMAELVNECDVLQGALDTIEYEARLGSNSLYLEAIGDL